MSKLSKANSKVRPTNWIGRAVFVAFTMIVAPFFAITSTSAASSQFQIRVLSNRPDMLSGGDALVRVEVPTTAGLGDVRVTLNNVDVTNVFRTNRAAHTMT